MGGRVGEEEGVSRKLKEYEIDFKKARKEGERGRARGNGDFCGKKEGRKMGRKKK